MSRIVPLPSSKLINDRIPAYAIAISLRAERSGSHRGGPSRRCRVWRRHGRLRGRAERRVQLREQAAHHVDNPVVAAPPLRVVEKQLTELLHVGGERLARRLLDPLLNRRQAPARMPNQLRERMNRLLVHRYSTVPSRSWPHTRHMTFAGPPITLALTCISRGCAHSGSSPSTCGAAPICAPSSCSTVAIRPSIMSRKPYSCCRSGVTWVALP